MQNYCDDDEVSAGRVILQPMKQNNIEKRAIFVVRYFGLNKIGDDRFTCIKEAAKSAIEAHPYNFVLKTDQQISFEQQRPQQARGQYQNPRSQRQPAYSGSNRPAGPRRQTLGRASYSGAISNSARRWSYQQPSRGRSITQPANKSPPFVRQSQREERNVSSDASQTKRKRILSPENVTEFSFAPPNKRSRGL